ncbi:MAG: protein-L-isoaspartate(D-aspartate) O-methyltransferase [Caldilineae bacterium]|nr:MAG: protein-L-isoaspartate(D-aspartate) O-methyltransferase [Caldilineae bacterium]
MGQVQEGSDPFAQERARMVKQQIERRGLKDPAILEAMRTVPRHLFVPEQYQRLAYEDMPLPIPAGQTISQPFIVAYMISLLDPQPTDRVLEIGAGSGYAAAVLSRVVAEVYTVERHEELVAYARERLTALGYDNIHIRHGDGTLGWPEHAPYDGIVVTACGPRVPPTLKEQLALGGRLVMPVIQDRYYQTLVRVTRVGEKAYQHEELEPVAFVPLVGEEGWPEEEAYRRYY